MNRLVLISSFLISLFGFSQTPITDNNIHSAVDLWVSNQTNAEATYGHISTWNTSNVTNMYELFRDHNNFNDDIAQWDVSSVIVMGRMFWGAEAFDQNINSWDVSNVTDMSYMFYQAGTFNQPLNNWDVSSVYAIDHMFMDAHDFNQDLSSWNISNVNNLSQIFAVASSFNQPLNTWNVSQVVNFNGAFTLASSFNQPLDNWNTSSVTDMNAMFYLAESFDQDLSNWDITNVINMGNMFDYSALSTDNYDNVLIAWSQQNLQDNVSLGAVGVTYCAGETARQNLINNDGWTITDDGLDPNCTPPCLIDDTNIQAAVDLWESNQTNAEATYGHISTWDTSCVTDMSELFESYTTFNEDIGSWDVSNVVNMHNMFGIASSFDQNISSWNVSNVTDMSYMFYSASNFNQDISNWSIGSVVNMQGMFFNATIFNQNISSWNVSNVTDMSYMFSYAAVFNQDISSWSTSNVTDMSAMFNSSSSFDQNLAVWDISNVVNMLTMFSFSGLSTNNYDNILIGWEPQVVISNVPLGAIGITYCTGETARQNLIDNYGWTITDDGIDPSCTASIDEESISNIYIYPNPVSNILNIKGNTGELSIIIYNILGKQIMSSKIINSIDVSSLNTGIYFIELSNGQQTALRKLIKK